MKRLIALVIIVSTLWLLPASVVVAAPLLQYQGAITSPREDAVLRGQVAVNGTADHPEFWKYEVRVTPGQNPGVRDDQWYRVVVRESPVINGQLAVWDTTVIPDGVYTLRLRVVRRDGNWQDFDVFPLNVANTVPPPPTSTPIPPPTETPPPPPTSIPETATPSPSPSPEFSPTPLVLATLTPFGETPATLTP
ncbi:MAG: hypothetical protein ACRDIB_11880, partial [Ardenticatenaceae bacterium]